MKTMMKLFLAAAMLMPLFLQAQSPLDKIYAKYVGNDKYVTVSFSKDMLQMFANMSDTKDTSSASLKRAAARLTSLKLVSMDVDSLKPAPAQAFYNEVVAIFPPSIYEELMRVNNNGTNTFFLTKKDAKGQITELVMLEKGKRAMVSISITGIIDLATVSKIAKTMDIKGMDELKNYNKPHKK